MMLSKLWDRIWAIWHRYFKKQAFYKEQSLKDRELYQLLKKHARVTGVKEVDVPAWICGFLCGAQGVIRFVDGGSLGETADTMKDVLKHTEKWNLGEA